MFRRTLRALGGSRRSADRMVGGRNVLVPPKPDLAVGGSRGLRLGGRMSAAERRRRNLTRLAGFIIVTFVLGLIPPLRFLLVLNLIADVLLIAYLGAAMYFAAFSRRTEPLPRLGAYPREISPPEAAGGGF